MEQIAPDIFQLPVPLPGSPLKEVNCFLIRGEGRHLLVDTAFNHPDCQQSLLGQLEAAGAALEDTDILVTHLHVDHSGLISRLKRPGNRVYVGVRDKALIEEMRHPSYWERIKDNNAQMGIPPPYRLDPADHVAFRMKSDGPVEIETLGEGDPLPVGGYRFQVVELPGHTPGQIGLWEPEWGMLFCGDHILNNISPNIAVWDLEEDYLGSFLDSLAKVRAMPVRRLFPAHRLPPEDIGGRIDALLGHHRERLDRMIDVLAACGRSMTTYEVALTLDWRSDKPLPEMAPQQRWFACSETLAHLQRLFLQSRIGREEKDRTLYYYGN